MAIELWTYPQEVGRVDVTGYEVEAADGKIGRVLRASLEEGSSYLVVETGPWILGKTVVLPAGAVTRVDRVNETVFVDLTKDEIKDAPEYDAEAGFRDEYREALARYYRRRYD